MRRRQRVGSSVAAIVLAVVGATTAAAAPAPVSDARIDLGASSLTGTGGVHLDDDAAATADATVTVAIPAPTTSAGLVRISNDGGSTWVERAYATRFAWSVIDPLAGGVDADGSKQVIVASGDGVAAWVVIGSDAILLDRTAPAGSPSPGFDGWKGFVDFSVVDAGVGVARTEVSLDGVHWRSLHPSPFSFYPSGLVDLREGTIGGSWTTGVRPVYVRAVDKLGNTSEPTSFDVTASDVRVGDDPPATFEFPQAAVTGSPFTIAPVFDDGFAVAPGDYCQWRLRAGSQDARLEAIPDETFIDVLFSVSAKDGVCAPWTFTLPYTPPLEYTWSLTIARGPAEAVYSTNPLAGSFRASLGSTSRAITTSNLPLYYLLPERDFVGTDGTVTYQLRTAGGAPARTGIWSCYHAGDGPGLDPQTQRGGTSFRCRVTKSGAWVADWAYETATRRWLVQYDPVGDRSRPVVSSVRTDIAPGAPIGTESTRLLVQWSARDRGSGIKRFQAQVSRDGGVYRTVTLESSRATKLERGARFGATYRFRIRAIDRAGNYGAWAYSSPVRAARYGDGSASVTRSAGWTKEAIAGAVGGTLHAATALGARATFRFSGRDVAWVARKGPGAGYAQVYVDGVLVDTVNLSAPSWGPSRAVWRRSLAKNTTHSVRIRVLGTTTGPRVEIDGFIVLR